MLKITVPMGAEYFDEETDEFVFPDSIELELEHSLVSLSKWESTFEKPFLDGKERSTEETLAYIEMMVVTPNFPRGFAATLPESELRKILDYINAKQTATWFKEDKSRPSRETITTELIYYWMFSLQIPIECENWHINRLMTLLRVFNIKNEPPKKMSQAQAFQQQRELNAQRRAQLGTSG